MSEKVFLSNLSFFSHFSIHFTQSENLHFWWRFLRGATHVAGDKVKLRPHEEGGAIKTVARKWYLQGAWTAKGQKVTARRLQRWLCVLGGVCRRREGRGWGSAEARRRYWYSERWRINCFASGSFLLIWLIFLVTVNSIFTKKTFFFK